VVSAEEMKSVMEIEEQQLYWKYMGLLGIGLPLKGEKKNGMFETEGPRKGIYVGVKSGETFVS